DLLGVEERVVGGQDRTTRDAEDDLDPGGFQGADQRLGTGDGLGVRIGHRRVLPHGAVRAGHKKPLAPDWAERGVRARQTGASDGALAKYYRDRQTHEETLADPPAAVKSPARVIHAFDPYRARRSPPVAGPRRKIFPKAAHEVEPDRGGRASKQYRPGG